MKVLQILENQIRIANGEGLCNGDRECGCQLGDLAPCYDISPECEIAANDPYEAEEHGCDCWMIPIPKPAGDDAERWTAHTPCCNGGLNEPCDCPVSMTHKELAGYFIEAVRNRAEIAKATTLIASAATMNKPKYAIPSVPRICPVCGRRFTGTSRQLVCSTTCANRKDNP